MSGPPFASLIEPIAAALLLSLATASCAAEHPLRCLATADQQRLYDVEYGAGAGECSTVTELQLLPPIIAPSVNLATTVVNAPDRTIIATAGPAKNCMMSLEIEVQHSSGASIQLFGSMQVSEDGTLRGTLPLEVRNTLEGPVVCRAKVAAVLTPRPVGTAGRSGGTQP